MGSNLVHHQQRRSKPHRRSLRRRLRWRGQALALRFALLLLRHRRHEAVRRWIQAAVRIGSPFLHNELTLGNNNLDRVYGAMLTPRQRQILTRLSLEHFLLSCLESIIEPVDNRIVVEGDGRSQLLHRPPGQGAIVASLHLGCWDLGLRQLSQHLDDVAVIYRPTTNPKADRLLNGARSANSHCRWISKNDTRAMLEWLRRGGTLVVMTDLHGRGNSVEVDALGLATQISAGPFRLSQKTGCPIFPGAHLREDDGRFRIHIGNPIAAPPGPDGPRLQAQALCRWQEPWIHRYCEQYLWIYRHWRNQEGERLRAAVAPGQRVLRLLPP